MEPESGRTFEWGLVRQGKMYLVNWALVGKDGRLEPVQLLPLFDSQETARKWANDLYLEKQKSGWSKSALEMYDNLSPKKIGSVQGETMEGWVDAARAVERCVGMVLVHPNGNGFHEDVGVFEKFAFDYHRVE